MYLILHTLLHHKIILTFHIPGFIETLWKERTFVVVYVFLWTRQNIQLNVIQYYCYHNHISDIFMGNMTFSYLAGNSDSIND